MSLLRALKLPPLPARAVQPAPPGNRAVGNAATKTEKLSLAAESWRRTHGQADERISALKASVKAHYADGHPALVQEVEKGLARLDEVLDNVDHRLADSLAQAGNAADDSALRAALKNAKSILVEYINYVKSEPLVAHIDRNPFKVKTDLRALLAAGLNDAAKAIG